jgi:tRNA A-37 threonylcarbamoyl transferase component Bud32/tetratricopeptide (TPR) repeat protein
MSLSAGDKLAVYEIIAPIGSGGMSEVYRARDSKLGRQVAIKVLPGHLAANESARERLRREAAAAAALDHPFICKVFEIGEDRETLFLAMELIEGETLDERLDAGRLTQTEALRFAGEVAEALEKAHSQGFVHRDLKPANVMIAHDHVKVMDFGLAKQIEKRNPISESAATLISVGPALTQFGVAIGTPDYMSPEQVRGEPLDQRSDLFSFGILLCELLGGQHPFQLVSQSETMAAILRDPPNLTGDLPQGLMLLIRRLLNKSREDRYQSMTEVRADLGRLIAGVVTAEPQKDGEPRIPLIGREAERKELWRQLEEALAGRGSMVMIGGEPGIGKTHLITAILEEARRRGAYANIGHCYEMEGSPPYVPFVEMLEHTARVAPKEGFRYALGDSASEIAKLMPELRRMYPDIPPAIQLPPAQQRRFLFNSYREFIDRAAKTTPIVHVFEDLHWADEPTLLLLQHIAQTLSTTPLLVIGTYRDVELDVSRPFAKTLETLLRQRLATRISLRRLSVGGVESMLAAMSGQKPPPSLARVVFEETEGNPFFVEELFRHLSEEGKLFDEAGQWRPSLRVDQLQVPEGVRLVLGRRLDRLGAEAQRVLATAAVVGRTFSIRLLEELENQHPDAVLDAIEEAERAHLVAAEPPGRDTRYRFVHELVRQTLSETLSLPRRQRLHARVAAAIERVYEGSLEAQASPLAHHLYQAGAASNVDKTTSYLMMAAKNAAAGAAQEEALLHLENALSLWEDEQGVRVAELTAQRAAALRSIGRWEEAVTGYQKAIGLFESAGELARAARISLTLAVDQGWHLELIAARRTIDHALGILGSTEPQLRMSLLAARAGVISNEGDAAGAADLIAEIRAQWDAVAGRPRNFFIEWVEMICLYHSMRFEQLLKTAGPSLVETPRAAGDLWGVAEAECFNIVCELACGRTEEAAGQLPGALRLAERVGHHGAVWMNRTTLGTLNMGRGDLLAAEHEMEEARKYGELHQLPYPFLNSISLGTLAFLRGNFAEAERYYSDRTEIEEQTHWAGYRNACLFAFQAESKGADHAWDSCNKGGWKLPRIGQPNPIGAWLALERSVIGLAALGRKEDVAALRPLTEDVLLMGVWAAWDPSPFRTAAGIAAACAGDYSAAEQHHLTAIQQMDTASFRVSQPMARESYARMLLDRKDGATAAKARGLLSEALAIYELIGMPFHARRVSEMLANG